MKLWGDNTGVRCIQPMFDPHHPSPHPSVFLSNTGYNLGGRHRTQAAMNSKVLAVNFPVWLAKNHLRNSHLHPTKEKEQIMKGHVSWYWHKIDIIACCALVVISFILKCIPYPVKVRNYHPRGLSNSWIRLLKTSSWFVSKRPCPIDSQTVVD